MADKTIRTGLDTGFFVLFSQQHSLAKSVWSAIGAGKRHAVVSGLTLYELHRLGLKGAIKPAYASQCLQSIPQACEVVWIDQLEQLTKSAQLGHGLGLSMADSIILSAFVTGDCREIYTTDTDLQSYRNRSIKVVNLR